MLYRELFPHYLFIVPGFLVDTSHHGIWYLAPADVGKLPQQPYGGTGPVFESQFQNAQLHLQAQKKKKLNKKKKKICKPST